MPNCYNDYVQVFLTRSNHSAGRFCSNNIGQYKPFPMYSVDGYARIHFHSDSADIGAGFYLSYWLMNTSRLSQNCVNTDNKLRSGFMFSLGWPYSYANDSVTCIHKITTGANRETKLVFIDLDLNHKGVVPSCNPDDDHIEIRGTNSSSPSFKTSSIISERICRAATTKVVVTRSKYIYVQFSRTIGPHDTSRRGYLLGYISYDIVATAKGATAKGTTTVTPLTAGTTTKSETTKIVTTAATTTKATTTKSTTKLATTATTTIVTKRPTTKTASTTNRITFIKETVTRIVTKGIKQEATAGGGGGKDESFTNSTIGLAVVSSLLFLVCLVLIFVTILRRKPQIPEEGLQEPQADLEAHMEPIAEEGEPQAAHHDYEEIGPEPPYLEPQNGPRHDGLGNHAANLNNNQQARDHELELAPQGRHANEERIEIAPNNEDVRYNTYINEFIVENNPSNPDRIRQRATLSFMHQNAQVEIDYKGPGQSNRGFSQ
eukprot:Seg1173.5 transcript_id=Seg1173.5/GoldUCD/mRNA.D3Y31 product=Cubilin protein_id=Seg1173.5/GoldUCD/D3Y31